MYYERGTREIFITRDHHAIKVKAIVTLQLIKEILFVPTMRNVLTFKYFDGYLRAGPMRPQHASPKDDRQKSA